MENSAFSFLKSKGTQLTLKFGLVAILILFLMIPKFMILDLISERKRQSENVIDEVSTGWGGAQTHTGPVLVIPYVKNVGTESETKYEMRNLIVMPDNLKIDGQLETTSKYRSLYKVLLYKTDLKVNGIFKIPSETNLAIPYNDIKWNEAYVAMGITDLKGIVNKISFKLNNTELEMKPGLGSVSYTVNPILKGAEFEQMPANIDNAGFSGLQGKTVLDPKILNLSFNYNLELKGSKSLNFVPIGKNSEVKLASKFNNPVFTGQFLPEHNTSENGFEAKWKVLEYNKSIPEFQTESTNINVGSDAFGLEVKELVDGYTKSSRAGKYMFLFTILTFLVVFLTEIVQKQKVHIFQYTLVGIALAIFFILLLSISEFLNFDFAYLIAGVATTLLIYLYSLSLFRDKKSSYLLLGLLVLLFGYIYLIIQLEQSALLVGSIGLFIIVAATMYVTRQFNWFDEED
jgi:inner membrane protein